jgi:RHS repeat-associated protein
MGTVRYTVVDGEVVAEKRGGVRRQYVPDPLGSTVALLENSQSKTDTFQYWPYGEEAARTGTTPTPLRFVGTLGYYRDSATRAYVRARQLDVRSGRWMTEDPIGFAVGFNLYGYVAGRPASMPDPSGYKPVRPNDPRFPQRPGWSPGDRYGCACVVKSNERCLRDAGNDAYNEEYHRFPHPPGRPPRGDRNGPADAFRHCMWACETRRNCGGAAYNCGVLGHESDDAWFSGQTWGHWNPNESPMDLANDERGRKCAVNSPRMSCGDCCMRDLRNGNLYILPPSFWVP